MVKVFKSSLNCEISLSNPDKILYASASGGICEGFIENSLGLIKPLFFPFSFIRLENFSNSFESITSLTTKSWFGSTISGNLNQEIKLEKLFDSLSTLKLVTS